MNIDALFTTQADNLSALLSLLTQELDAIKKRNPDLLLELVKQRETQLGDIEQIDKQLANHPDLADFKQTDEFTQMLKVIDKHLADCRRLTAINEKAVKQGQINSTHFRTVLLQQLGRNSVVYDSSGKTQGRVSRHNIKA